MVSYLLHNAFNPVRVWPQHIARLALREQNWMKEFQRWERWTERERAREGGAGWVCKHWNPWLTNRWHATYSDYLMHYNSPIKSNFTGRASGRGVMTTHGTRRNNQNTPIIILVVARLYVVRLLYWEPCRIVASSGSLAVYKWGVTARWLMCG